MAHWLEVPFRGYNRHYKLLKEKSVVCPPLPEQRCIAAILTAVQRAIELQERLISLTTELKKAYARGIYSVKHYKGKFNVYQRIYVFTLKDEQIMPYLFLLYAVATRLDYLRIVSIGTSTKYLTLGIFKKLSILQPEYDEAQQLGDTLSIVDKKIEEFNEKRQLLDSFFRTLLHQLMTAQIRVNEVDLSELKAIGIEVD